LLNQTYKSTVDNSALLLEVMGFVVGDVLGLIFCLVSIVYLFRMIRFSKIIPDR
jgi:tellurite resistance protein TehA-like permease